MKLVKAGRMILGFASLAACACGAAGTADSGADGETTESDGSGDDTGTLECEPWPAAKSERVVWTKEFDHVDAFVGTYDAFATSDDRIIVVGKSVLGSGGLTTVSAHSVDGDLEWSWSRDFVPNGEDSPDASASPGVSGGFILGVDARGKPGAWVGSFSAVGDEQWGLPIETPLGPAEPGWSAADAIAGTGVDEEGDVFVLGTTLHTRDGAEQPPAEDEVVSHAWLLRVGPDGQSEGIVWSAQGVGERFATMQLTQDAVYVADYVDTDLYVKTDTRAWRLAHDGSVAWAKEYDFAAVESTRLGATASDSLFVTGLVAEELDLNLREADAFVAEIDIENGEPRWAKTYGYCKRDEIFARSVSVEGGLLVLQNLAFDWMDPLNWAAVLRRTDAQGETLWTEWVPLDGKMWVRHLAFVDGAAVVVGTKFGDPRTYVMTKMSM